MKLVFWFVQEELVSWLGEEMSHQGLDVDQLDIAANSPLHLAAKNGFTTSAAILLHHGAQVTLKVSFEKTPFFRLFVLFSLISLAVQLSIYFSTSKLNTWSASLVFIWLDNKTTI